MKLTPLKIDLNEYPKPLHQFLNAPVYDSSCSEDAKVIYINKDKGYFLKISKKNTLAREAKLTQYFHQKNLAPEVIFYLCGEKDWLLTSKVIGHDCIEAKYQENPSKLCDLLAQKLLDLHLTSFEGCPVPNHTELYIQKAEQNYYKQKYDLGLFSDNWTYKTPKEAYDVITTHSHLLKSDTLLHGDYCLPNIILDNWKFSGFIDLDSGGVGDKHVDIFWAIWTFQFNFKTDKYKQRFIDAYGKHLIDEDMLRLIAAIEVFG